MCCPTKPLIPVINTLEEFTNDHLQKIVTNVGYSVDEMVYPQLPMNLLIWSKAQSG